MGCDTRTRAAHIRAKGSRVQHQRTRRTCGRALCNRKFNAPVRCWWTGTAAGICGIGSSPVSALRKQGADKRTPIPLNSWIRHARTHY
jgi:hypothetical protein